MGSHRKAAFPPAVPQVWALASFSRAACGLDEVRKGAIWTPFASDAKPLQIGISVASEAVTQFLPGQLVARFSEKYCDTAAKSSSRDAAGHPLH